MTWLGTIAPRIWGPEVSPSFSFPYIDSMLSILTNYSMTLSHVIEKMSWNFFRDRYLVTYLYNSVLRDVWEDTVIGSLYHG